jgi:hypothetical protein
MRFVESMTRANTREHEKFGVGRRVYGAAEGFDYEHGHERERAGFF